MGMFIGSNGGNDGFALHSLPEENEERDYTKGHDVKPARSGAFTLPQLMDQDAKSLERAARNQNKMKVAHLCENCSKTFPICEPCVIVFAGNSPMIQQAIDCGKCEKRNIDAVVACDEFKDARDI